jgi:ComF family protein
MTRPCCEVCGHSLARPEDFQLGVRPLCRSCAVRAGAIDRARSSGEYEGPLREIIHAFKYDKRLSLARPLAELMKRQGAELLDDDVRLVPVPLHPRRQRERGFNQARELAKHVGPPVADVLLRTRHTPPQVELEGRRRYANVQGAFRLKRRSEREVGGARLILIDDVTTTGATLQACAEALKAAGALEVSALTAARA